VIECKNASKDEAIALGVDQLRLLPRGDAGCVPEMIFSATEAIGFAYGVTWNTVRRNIFNWKHTEAATRSQGEELLRRAAGAACAQGFSSSSRRKRRSCKVSS